MSLASSPGPGPLMVQPEALAAAPHESFARLRVDHPVVTFGQGHYLVLRARDVLFLLTDARTRQVNGDEYASLNRMPDGITRRFQVDFFLFHDGDAHRARRGLFARRFAHRVMQDSRAIAGTIARRIVADLPRGETFDFVDRVAARVPAEMIAGILGLPAEETDRFTRWVYEVALAISPVYPHEHHEAIEAATGQLFDYVAGHLNARLAAPREDFLSALVRDWKDDPVIDFESLTFQVMGIIIGGSDTTRAAFAMLTALLLADRGQWEALLSDRALVAGAVSEALRFEPSVGTIPRVLTEPLAIGGVAMPAGSILRLSTMSAMRDPDLYSDPDRFDIRRTDHPQHHPVFGHGPHRCLGEMLSRIEMEESLAALLDAAPGIEMEVAPRMLGFGGIRRITPMAVRLP
ncbi:cytochrome P450 [Acuticoccus kandeliae]|uniref:cytochrome P450 n=1 Tax=Acuticoccus kandeliae TaxID=2073160 RepID=UPI000D3E8A31|nr:cytochrome P450 [Acuticoccus kandeliae]